MFLNRYDGDDDLHQRNRAWLHDHTIGAAHVVVTVDELATIVTGHQS